MCKALSLFSGCARAVNDLPESAVALSPLFDEVWPHVKVILQKRANDNEITELCCDFLSVTIKALVSSQVDLTPLFMEL